MRRVLDFHTGPSTIMMMMFAMFTLNMQGPSKKANKLSRKRSECVASAGGPSVASEPFVAP